MIKIIKDIDGYGTGGYGDEVMSVFYKVLNDDKITSNEDRTSNYAESITKRIRSWILTNKRLPPNSGDRSIRIYEELKSKGFRDE